MIGLIILITIFTLTLFLLLRLTKNNDHWEKMNVPHIKPLPLVGNMLQNVIKMKSIGEILRDITLEKSNDKIIGAYNITGTPILVVNDVEFAEIVLIKEFYKFMDRGPHIPMDQRRALDKHLFNLTGNEWKALRSKMSPIFSTVRLNQMIPQITKLIHDKPFEIIRQSNDKIELLNLVEYFSMTVRASIVFGMEVDSEFMSRVKDINKFEFFDYIKLMISLFFRRLANKLDLSIFRKHEDYFVSLVLRELDRRAKTGLVKNDIIQTLFELKNVGCIRTKQWYKEDDIVQMDTASESHQTIEISDDILVSASFIFMLAGFDALKTTASMLIIELCKNKRVYDKLQTEVDSVMKKHREMNHEALKEMKYLEQCIQETLRLYPPNEIINRLCVKKHTFDNGVTVEPGTFVFVPTLRFHMDPDIYKEPLTFNPERFESSPPSCTFLAFGDGPRKCIAPRYAMMEMKLFLSQLIYHYKITLDDETELPVKNNKWFVLRRPITPIYIKCQKIEH